MFIELTGAQTGIEKVIIRTGAVVMVLGNVAIVGGGREMRWTDIHYQSGINTLAIVRVNESPDRVNELLAEAYKP